MKACVENKVPRVIFLDSVLVLGDLILPLNKCIL